MTDLPDVKLKALISFPANVLDGTGVDVVKANGTYQFNLDFGDFAPPVAAVTDSAQQNALLWNANTGAYSLVPISVLLTGSTPSDALPVMDGIAAAGVSALYSRGDHKHPTDTTLATTAALTAAVAPLVETVKVQTFTASGTYTPSTGMLYCIAECVGGGGGGGGSAATSAGQFGVGAGGGGGAYSRSVLTAATIGASQAVTIGAAGAGVSGANGTAGGTTSLGVLVTAPGGGLGSVGTASASSGSTGGSGGALGTGNITLRGSPGSNSIGINPTIANAGVGGVSGIGSGGAATAILGGVGVAATGYGGGGAGASLTASQAAVAGGAGAPGLVIITEFCSQ